MPQNIAAPRIKEDIDSIVLLSKGNIVQPAIPKHPSNYHTTTTTTTSKNATTTNGTTNSALPHPSSSPNLAKIAQSQFPPVPICHGRLQSIEKMVPAQWWTTVFDAMYLKTDGDMVEDVEVTKDEVGMLERDAQLKSVFLTGSKLHEAPGKILDLCSGQGRHSIFLAKKIPLFRAFWPRPVTISHLARARKGSGIEEQTTPSLYSWRLP